VESEGAGQGTVFTFSLPCVPERANGRHTTDSATPASNETAKSANRLPKLDGVSILLVDDDDDAREVLCAMLRRYDADVTGAASVAQAMDHLAQQLPDLIISDISMPGEDGYSLIQKVKALSADGKPSVPAIALTAHVRSSDRDRMLAAGYLGHVAKPVDPASLIATMERVLARPLAETPTA
jgi:CheY-like chemotaxis protein